MVNLTTKLINFSSSNAPEETNDQSCTLDLQDLLSSRIFHTRGFFVSIILETQRRFWTLVVANFIPHVRGQKTVAVVSMNLTSSSMQTTSSLGPFEWWRTGHIIVFSIIGAIELFSHSIQSQMNSRRG